MLSGLTLVSVTTAQDDNVYRIFESLNNTGLKLTQGDLLRNYLFMRLPTRGEVLYETVWLPLQRRLTNDQLELLFWLDAVQRDDAVNQRETYRAQVNRLDALPDEASVAEEMHRFHRLSGLLELILNPERESDPAVRERLSPTTDRGARPRSTRCCCTCSTGGPAARHAATRSPRPCFTWRASSFGG